MNNHKRTRTQWLALLGLVGTHFYFLHVILGKLNYPGYNSLAQAISDLTAANAPSREIASALSTVNGFFTVAACTLFCVFFQDKVNKVFRVGIYLFTVMQWISAVGYTLFSLSESGYAGAFQDVMHMVVTAFVVILSIISMILIAIGCFKSKAHKSFGILIRYNGNRTNRDGYCSTCIFWCSRTAKRLFCRYLYCSIILIYI